MFAIHDAEDGTVVMLEKWTTRAGLDAHAAGPAVVQLNALIAPYLAGQVTVTTMKPLPAGRDSQGRL